jgi:hypothetical protein
MIGKPLKRKLQVLRSAVSVSLVALAAGPAFAGGPDAVFYELTETMTYNATTNTRKGEGALAGEAKRGTPLCPQALMDALVAGGVIRRPSARCYVTAYGADALAPLLNEAGQVVTWMGPLQATIAVKVQGDNPIDAPEAIVMTGKLEGQLWVADENMRLLGIAGSFVADLPDGTTAAPVPFSGKVRLPFVKDEDGRHRRPWKERAFYLRDDGKLERVQDDEMSLGRPTARFELNFPSTDN